MAQVFLAQPATAIGRGECCADVNGICISTCTKDSCTGNGDCSLAFTSRPPSVQSSSSALSVSFRTVSRQNQTFLENLFAGLNPTGSGERPDGEPIHFETPPVDDYKNPDIGVGVPTMSQMGSTLAYVPMEHASCGPDCVTHGLAVETGNLDVPFKIRMSCPAGQEVSFVAYQLAGQSQGRLVEADTGSATFEADITAQPFSASELETTCAAALGGGWGTPGNHNNPTKVEEKTIKETVEVWGKCSSWANTAKRSAPVALTLTCDDLSWYAADPEP